MNCPKLIEENVGIRLTVDNIDDFNNCQNIFSTLKNTSDNFNYINIIDYINTDFELKTNMIEQIKKNEK